MRVVDRIRRFVQQHELVRPESRVAIAVSGGSDSMALLLALRTLAARGELKIAGIIHFNHQLRPTADDHERFVREAARAFSLPFVSDRADVASVAARDGGSIEHTARRVRHEFFSRARFDLEADRVAVGHTQDDQAETFLLRLIRGAGPRGLSAMHPRNGAVVRPLLACGRLELREWLGSTAPLAGSRQYLEDETNQDVTIPRNRVRHELVPLLEKRFSPSIATVLAREAALLQDVWAWMEHASAPFLETPGVLNVARIRKAPAALQRLVVWRSLSAGSGGREITSDHVAAVVRLIQLEATPGGHTLDLPGQRVQRIGEGIVLTGGESSRGPRSPRMWNSFENENPENPANLTNFANPANPANQFRYPLSIPGEVFVREADLVISAERVARPEPGRSASSGNGVEALVRGDLIGGTLAVRNRRPGDRFRPVGLRGSKKLQDLFVDRKLARARRDTVPLVVDGLDRIVWVAGYGIDDAFRVTDPSQAVLVLRLTRASQDGAPEWFGGSA